MSDGGGRRTVVAALGGVERSGPWQVPPRLRVIGCLGGVKLDLREADIGEEGLEISAFLLLGGLEVTVPPGASVELSGLALAGGNSLQVKPQPGSAGPRIRIRATSILGDTEVGDGGRDS